MYCSAAAMDSIRSAALRVVGMVFGRVEGVKGGLTLIIPDAAEYLLTRFGGTWDAWGLAAATLRTCTKSAQKGEGHQLRLLSYI